MRARAASIEEERTALREIVGIMLANTQRLAVSKVEAADLLGVSPDFFVQHVMPEIRCVRRGRRRLFPIVELIYWLWRAAEEENTLETA